MESSWNVPHEPGHSIAVNGKKKFEQFFFFSENRDYSKREGVSILLGPTHDGKPFPPNPVMHRHGAGRKAVRHCDGVRGNFLPSSSSLEELYPA